MADDARIETPRLVLLALDAATARAIVAGLPAGGPGRPTSPPRATWWWRVWSPPLRARELWQQPWLVLHEGGAVGTAGFKGPPQEGALEFG